MPATPNANKQTAPVATATEGEVKKRKRASGPRKAADTHVFARITDAEGNPVEGAQLSVQFQTKDAKQVIKYMDDHKSDHSLQRFVIGGSEGKIAAVSKDAPVSEEPNAATTEDAPITQ